MNMLLLRQLGHPLLVRTILIIYCLWVYGPPKENGYGKSLMAYCLADAKGKGKSGICMFGAKKQKAWLSDQSFAKKSGFEVVDSTNDGYELLALSFDGTIPRFSSTVTHQIENQELTIFYGMQCPYIDQTVKKIGQYCEINNIPITLNEVDTLEKAKKLPGVFNNFSVFYKGNFETGNLLDIASIKRILNKR